MTVFTNFESFGSENVYSKMKNSKSMITTLVLLCISEVLEFPRYTFKYIYLIFLYI